MIRNPLHSSRSSHLYAEKSMEAMTDIDVQVRCSGAAVLRAIFMWAVVGGLGEIWRELV